MIEVTDHRGGAVLVNPRNIVTVTEASVSGRWHSINSIIKLDNGAVIESRDTVQDIRKKRKEVVQ